jgi:hypothetical protein
VSNLSDLKKSIAQKDIQILKSDELENFRNTNEPLTIDDRMAYSSGLLAVNTRKNYFLVHEQGLFKFYWELLIVLITIYNCFSMPVALAFQPPDFKT